VHRLGMHARLTDLRVPIARCSTDIVTQSVVAPIIIDNDPSLMQPI
jgi:hypothetical protein